MGKCSFDTLKVKKAILERAGGNIELYTLRYQPSFRTLETVLNFSQSEICKTTETSEKCTLPGALPSELKVTPDSVSLQCWGLSSTLTEIFLLQEARGIPQVASGRITGDKEWKELLSLHNAQFDLLQRTPAVARTGGNSITGFD